jgi:hypothetical protein
MMVLNKAFCGNLKGRKKVYLETEYAFSDVQILFGVCSSFSKI